MLSMVITCVNLPIFELGQAQQKQGLHSVIMFGLFVYWSCAVSFQLPACSELVVRPVGIIGYDQQGLCHACRNHRGLRHYWGLRVKGQHTKTTGRRGKTVGVAKKR